MQIPICANYSVEHSCERSDTYVERETDTAFVIRCKTCQSISIWPKDREEKRGKYEAYLRVQAEQRQKVAQESRLRAYSILGTRPGERT